jgi:hypothetical protein
VASAEHGAGRELPLRIRVVRPPAGVALGIQRGADEWLPPVSVSADAAVLEATVRVAADGAGAPPRVLGALAHGPPRARFVYVTWGRRAGQPESPWDRRAKVPLAGITAPLVGEALATRGAVLEASIDGTGRDGGPACASVALRDGGWRVVVG